MKSKRIKIPFFNITWKILCYENPEELTKKFKNVEFSFPPEEYDAGVFMIGNVFYMAFHIENKPSPGIIAHECKHLVNGVFNFTGQELDSENDEFEAYFLGWAVDKVHEFMDKITSE